MTKKITFELEAKDETLNPRQLRATGKLPATIYGKGVESVSVQLDAHGFMNTYKNNKDSVYELSLADKKYTAVVQKIQKNYATNTELNIEFKLV
jgi:large subunit ribosomal protein L25